jgi:chitin disaccharide deacetylase
LQSKPRAVVNIRRLIVNADDFGQSEGVSRGIIEAHERGIVTSASLMVLWPAAVAAAAYARADGTLSTGLHVDLGEWIWCDGVWACRYQRVDLDDTLAVEREVRGQLDSFRDLIGRNPTHLDSHQHVHRREPVRSTLAQIANELGVPLRHVTPGIRYCGDFYGQTATGAPLPESITVAALVWSLVNLEPGVTELACHPGYAEDLDTFYQKERTVEVRTLCADEVRAVLEDQHIQLTSFDSLAAVS